MMIFRCWIFPSWHRSTVVGILSRHVGPAGGLKDMRVGRTTPPTTRKIKSMATRTEGKHPFEFLISEGNGDRSREVGTVEAAQNLAAGTIIVMSGGKLIAMLGTLNTDLTLAENVEGVVLNNVNASATGHFGEADWPGQPYIKRAAEVNGGDLTYPVETTDGNEKMQIDAQLKALGIIVR
jgi:hypothetical protein